MRPQSLPLLLGALLFFTSPTHASGCEEDIEINLEEPPSTPKFLFREGVWKRVLDRHTLGSPKDSYARRHAVSIVYDITHTKHELLEGIHSNIAKFTWVLGSLGNPKKQTLDAYEMDQDLPFIDGSTIPLHETLKNKGPRLDANIASLKQKMVDFGINDPLIEKEVKSVFDAEKSLAENIENLQTKKDFKSALKALYTPLFEAAELKKKKILEAEAEQKRLEEEKAKQAEKIAEDKDAQEAEEEKE